MTFRISLLSLNQAFKILETFSVEPSGRWEMFNQFSTRANVN